MKKTLIAASVAALVAAPAAFADVAISGNVIQEFVTDSDDTGSSEDGLMSKAAVDLVFKVSEDLGNGMSAFATIHTLRDNGTSGNADQVVGLKGDFGTVVVGRMESFSEGKVNAMGANDSSDYLTIEPNGAYDSARMEGGMAYVSPSFNGLTFGIAGYAMPNGEVAAVAGTTISKADGTTTVIGSSAAVSKDATAKIDATDIMVEYANGPLLVRASHEVVDKQALNVSQTTGADQKTTNVAFSYKMDNITLQGNYFDVDNGQGVTTNDTDGYFIGAKVAMGANTFAVGYTEETNVDCVTSTGVCTKQTTGDDDQSYIVSVDHALSKRTSLTAGYKSFDGGKAGDTDKDELAVGLKHVF